MKRLTILLAVAALAGCASRSSQPTTPRSGSLETFAATLDTLRQKAKIPGLAVAVVRDGQVVLARGFGYADLEAGVPVTEDTPFDIASVTKTISGVVALRLVELGKLDLDRPLGEDPDFREWCADTRGAESIFFKDFRCDSEPMTERNLLTMTSNGKPGAKFFYNPVVYSWASRPMMKATGRAFSDLVAEYVFRPAGMTHSARRNRNLPLPADIAAALAKPYKLDAEGKLVRAEGPGPQGDGAAGGVISTARDLARFDIALDQGKLLKPASKKVLWSPTVSPSGEVLPYGIGWFVQDYQGHRLLWHSGWWPEAYSALYLKVPEKRLTLILLANSEGVWWDNPPDKAEVQKSKFAAAFLEQLAGFRTAGR